MQHLEVNGAVRPLQSSLGVKRLKPNELFSEGNTVCVFPHGSCAASVMHRKPTKYVSFQLPSPMNKLDLLKPATYPA